MKLYRTQFCILQLTKSSVLDTVRKPRPPFSNPAKSIFNARALDDRVNGFQFRHGSILQYSSSPRGSSVRAYRKRVNRRLRVASKPVLDEARFNKAKSLLPPRFTADHLHDVIVREEDPLVCLELFNWASQQPRFRHNVNSYHITIKKLGAAQMYEEMDTVVNQILAVHHIGSEALYNTMIYYYTEVRKLTRSVIVFKHMKDCKNLECRPSIKTYNLMFAAFLSRRSNTHVNHMYMETMSCLFRQLISDGIEPDIFTLNCIIKGYVMSNHVNDALRIFHQIGAVYNCQPNAASYDCLVHGLCAQGRTINAKELCKEMHDKGFVLSAKTYNSLVNALSLNGEVEEAVQHLREMTEKKKTADFITYRTILDQLCREGKVREAKSLLEEVKGKKTMDAPSYKKLLSVLEDDFAYGRGHRSSFQTLLNRHGKGECPSNALCACGCHDCSLISHIRRCLSPCLGSSFPRGPCFENPYQGQDLQCAPTSYGWVHCALRGSDSGAKDASWNETGAEGYTSSASSISSYHRSHRSIRRFQVSSRAQHPTRLHPPFLARINHHLFILLAMDLVILGLCISTIEVVNKVSCCAMACGWRDVPVSAGGFHCFCGYWGEVHLHEAATWAGGACRQLHWLAPAAIRSHSRHQSLGSTSVRLIHHPPVVGLCNLVCIISLFLYKFSSRISKHRKSWIMLEVEILMGHDESNCISQFI